MKLALILKRIAENDATQWITNLAGVRYKSLSDDVLLVFNTGADDALIQKLHQGLSGGSSVALFVLNGLLHGVGNAGNAEQQIQALFGH
jgi:hypothetical protein